MRKMILPTHGGGGDFKPAPAGLHSAVCVDVVDLGWEPPSERFPNSNWTPKIRLVWQLGKTFKDDEGNERRFIVSKRLTLSIHKKSNLRPLIEGWLNKQLDDDAIEAAGGIDLDRLINLPCALNIVHKEYTKDGEKRIWAEVTSVSPLAEGMARVEPDGEYVRAEDRDDYEPKKPSAFEPRLAQPIGSGADPLAGASDPHPDISFGKEPGDGIPPWDEAKDGPLPDIFP